MSGNARSAQETEQLILDYMPVVGYVVSEFITRLPMSVEVQDLAQVGYIALVRAAREYDPERGMTFRGFVNLRVRRALLDELRRIDHLSRAARARVRTLETLESELASQLKRQPTDEELASVMGVTVENVALARQHGGMRSVSLDELRDAEDSAFDLRDDEALDPEDAALHSERLVYLRAGVDTLPDRLRFVVEASFWSDMNDTQIGEHLGVSRSQVSHLRAEALTLLRDAMNASLDPEMVTVPERKEGVAARRRAAYYAAVAAKASMLSQMSSMPTSVEAAAPVPSPALELIRGERAA